MRPLLRLYNAPAGPAENLTKKEKREPPFADKLFYADQAGRGHRATFARSTLRGGYVLGEPFAETSR